MESIYLQKNKNKFVHLFSCCILVKGFVRSAIYDIQRENIEFVPNTLIDFVEDIRGQKVNNILEGYQGNETAREYFKFLEEREFIFYSSNNFFPDLPILSINEDISEVLFATVILSPYILSNIDLFTKNIRHLGVKRLHIHIDKSNCMEQVLKILISLEYSQVSNLSFSLPYQKINNKVYAYNRLASLIIFNSPEKKLKKNNDVVENYICCDDSQLFLTRFNLSDLAIGINAYNVARNYNLALYKTIFIDENGNIKHTFSDIRSYGNILEGFEETNSETIKKLSNLWNITKDSITPCNVCEFRYCCTTTYLPEKTKTGYTVNCNYNPYTAEFI